MALLPCSSFSAAAAAAAAAVLLLLLRSAAGGPVATEFLYPNFTASNFLYVDTAGVFLSSSAATFSAAIINPGKQQSRFYLVLIHNPTHTLVWSANRNYPIPISGTVVFTPSGLSISPSPGAPPVWSTPPLPSSVHSLRLLDSGNLLLLDSANATLWQSFDHPTDTLLSGQHLSVGSSLTGSTDVSDLSDGDYRLLLTSSDAALLWTGPQQYWAISTDPRSAKDYSAAVSYMTTNSSGLYLFSGSGRAVFEVSLPVSGFRIMKLDSGGWLRITSYSNASSSSSMGGDFVAPASDCDLPFSCKSLGLCTAGGGSKASTCSCQNPLAASNSQTGGCSPADGSILASCSISDTTQVSYLSLGSGVNYFANKFAAPTTSGEDFAACRGLCSGNCSCLGFFYVSSSKSCYLLKDRIGSLVSSSTEDAGNSPGYVKTLASPKSGNSSNTSSSKMGLLGILLPTIAAALLVGVILIAGSVWWRRAKRRRYNLRMKEIQLGRHKPSFPPPASDDEDDISIPGLPARFTYAELEAATNGFRTKIGSGGFGSVYKGTLPDSTTVAVKRIAGVGVQGRREFCTEIAVIGNIRHVNLVRLRGFCAEGPQRLLVYEYMSRGSLDRTLFGPGPALEWSERLEVAVGAARGLAYLHGGCEQRIVHCDVKPENILLHDGGQVKIADFGLAKLLTPEQSGFFTTMRGTRGYLAPEWLTNAAISDKTDVYSFGMVLLEIVRGRKNRSQESEAAAASQWTSGDSAGGGGGGGGGGVYFPLVALEMHERRRYLELADPRLEGRATAEEVGRVVRAALCCLHEEPGLRPGMAAVAGMLEGTMEVWEPRVESLSFLRLYGRGFAAAAAAAASGDGAMYGGGNLTSALTSSASTTSGSFSYLTSQQVSGPR